MMIQKSARAGWKWSPVADLLCKTPRALLFSSTLSARCLYLSPPTHACTLPGRTPPPETSRVQRSLGVLPHGRPALSDISRQPFLIVTRWRVGPVAPGCSDRTPLLSLCSSRDRRSLKCCCLCMHACVRSKMFIHSIFVFARTWPRARACAMVMKLTVLASRVPALALHAWPILNPLVPTHFVHQNMFLFAGKQVCVMKSGLRYIGQPQFKLLDKVASPI